MNVDKKQRQVNECPETTHLAVCRCPNNIKCLKNNGIEFLKIKKRKIMIKKLFPRGWNTKAIIQPAQRFLKKKTQKLEVLSIL